MRSALCTDKYGNDRPIESPEVSYWVRDDEHPEQGYMETQSPYYMEDLSDILRFLPVNFPVLVQICMPQFTEAFYVYTLDANDGPPATLYTTAWHADYRNPMIGPIHPQAITDALLADVKSGTSDGKTRQPHNCLLRTADWMNLLRNEEYVVFRMYIRAWLVSIYECGVQTI